MQYSQPRDLASLDCLSQHGRSAAAAHGAHDWRTAPWLSGASVSDAASRITYIGGDHVLIYQPFLARTASIHDDSLHLVSAWRAGRRGERGHALSNVCHARRRHPAPTRRPSRRTSSDSAAAALAARDVPGAGRRLDGGVGGRGRCRRRRRPRPATTPPQDAQRAPPASGGQRCSQVRQRSLRAATAERPGGREVLLACAVPNRPWAIARPRGGGARPLPHLEGQPKVRHQRQPMQHRHGPSAARPAGRGGCRTRGGSTSGWARPIAASETGPQGPPARDGGRRRQRNLPQPALRLPQVWSVGPLPATNRARRCRRRRRTARSLRRRRRPRGAGLRLVRLHCLCHLGREGACRAQCPQWRAATAAVGAQRGPPTPSTLRARTPRRIPPLFDVRAVLGGAARRRAHPSPPPRRASLQGIPCSWQAARARRRSTIRTVDASSRTAELWASVARTHPGGTTVGVLRAARRAGGAGTPSELPEAPAHGGSNGSAFACRQRHVARAAGSRALRGVGCAPPSGREAAARRALRCGDARARRRHAAASSPSTTPRSPKGSSRPRAPPRPPVLELVFTSTESAPPSAPKAATRTCCLRAPRAGIGATSAAQGAPISGAAGSCASTSRRRGMALPRGAPALARARQRCSAGIPACVARTPRLQRTRDHAASARRQGGARRPPSGPEVDAGGEVVEVRSWTLPVSFGASLVSISEGLVGAYSARAAPARLDVYALSSGAASAVASAEAAEVSRRRHPSLYSVELQSRAPRQLTSLGAGVAEVELACGPHTCTASPDGSALLPIASGRLAAPRRRRARARVSRGLPARHAVRMVHAAGELRPRRPTTRRWAQAQRRPRPATPAARS